MESWPLYTLYLFSIFLNDDIVDIEKPNKIFSLAFVVNNFCGFFLHPSVFTIKDSRSA